ncbi:MAG TPA: respiratory nitrate reductase subunit gamma [Kofleriaceae bacterium]|jgi:nitrate reductase gamma subunit|nr:respiratory nitrate reductase subunit gamma [Kofleriaceae bacterium]
MTRARVFRVALVAALVVHVGLIAGTANADPAEAKKIFTTRCMACHTFGKGVKVGPDLKGVNERRQRAWLLKFVRSSSVVIASGDPIAADLFQQFKQQRMPDWTDLSEDQVTSILDWLGINGPEQQEPDARLAEVATVTDIETGRELFHGARSLANGGSACATCHSIRDEGNATGGTLAPDLTNAYSVYQDVSMTLFLKRPCFLRYPESAESAESAESPGLAGLTSATPKPFLTPEESFAIKAYLRTMAVTAQPASAGLTMASKVREGDGQDPSTPPPTIAVTSDRPTAHRAAWEPPTKLTPPGIGRGAHIQGELLFLAFPYAALLVLLIGLGIRYAIARRQPDAIRPAASAAWKTLSGSKAWRTGLAVTFALHLLGLLWPHAILGWNGSPARLYLLEATGFVLGVVALIGWVQIMWRHLGRGIASARAGLGELADCILLSVLCMAVVSGLVTAFLYRWGTSWGAETLAPYMSSLAHGAPAPVLVEEMPFLVRLHVFAWFVAVALVPFTSVAAMLLPGIDRVMLLVARPVSAAAGAGKRIAARLSPARWLWPEEDAVDLEGDADNAQEPS